MPNRIQRKRTLGWKMPENTVYVGRGSKWGNPFTWDNSGNVHPAVRFACEVAPLLDVSSLRGKNLACWCPVGAECHADVLLQLANPKMLGTGSESASGLAQCDNPSPALDSSDGLSFMEGERQS